MPRTIKRGAIYFVFAVLAATQGLAQDNRLAVPYVRTIDVGDTSYRQINPRAWAKFDAQGERANTEYLEQDRTDRTIELLDLVGQPICFDLAARTMTSGRRCNASAGGRQQPITGFDHAATVADTPIDNLDRIVAVRGSEFDFERVGSRWNMRPHSGRTDFPTTFGELRRGDGLIVLNSAEAGNNGYVTLDLRENRIFFEGGDAPPSMSTIVSMRLSDLEDDPLFENLSVGEAIATGPAVRIRYGTTARFVQRSGNDVVLGSSGAARSDSSLFVLEQAPGAQPGNFRLRAPSASQYVYEDSRGLLRTTDKEDDATIFKADPSANRTAFFSVRTGKMWTDRSRRGPIELIRSRFGGGGFALERAVDDVISIEVKADVVGGKSMPPRNLLQGLTLAFVTRDGTVFPVESAWSEAVASGARDSFQIFKLDFSDLPSGIGSQLRDTPLGSIVRLSITNTNNSDNVLVGSVRLRNHELFQCGCTVHPEEAAGKPVLVVSEQAKRGGDGFLPTTIENVRPALKSLRRAQMSGTPQFKQIGAELFHGELVTELERQIFRDFLNSYPDDFINVFLALDIPGDTPPAINVETVKSAFESLEERYASADGETSLSHTKHIVLDQVEARRVALVLFDRAKRMIEEKYEVAHHELDVFREYSEISNPRRRSEPSNPSRTRSSPPLT